MSDQNILWPKEGRRQPIMVGRDASGKPLPGGPYTLYQLAAVLVVGAVGFATRNLWGEPIGMIGQLIYILGAAFLASMAAGRIDFVSANPLWTGTGWVKATISAFTHPDGTMPRPRTLPQWKAPKAQTKPGRVLQVMDEPIPADEDDADVTDQDMATGDVEESLAAPVAGGPMRRPRLRLHRKTRRDETASTPPQEAPATDPVTEPQMADDNPNASVAPTPSSRQTGLERFLAAADRSHP